MRPRPALLAALAACAVASCSEHTAPEPTYVEIPITQRTRPVDMLFVIDNSGSMCEEQELLVRDGEQLFRELVEVSSIEDLHVGVITADMGAGGHAIMTCYNPDVGDNGMLQNAGRLPGCQPEYAAPDCEREVCPWLALSIDPSEPPIWEEFGCMATLGTGGCGFEHTLESALVALTTQLEPGGYNEGFLRDDSILTLVIVTDEDDCSASDGDLFDLDHEEFGPPNTRCAMNPDQLHPIERYADALCDLRPDDLLVMAAIIGIPTDGSWNPGDPLDDLRDMQQVNPENSNELLPSCMTDMGLAYPPVRIVDLVYRFGEAGVLGSVCRDDWSDTMAAIATAIQARLPARCVELPEGVNPATDCRLLDADTGEIVEGWRVLDSGGTPCPGGELRLGDGVAGEVRLECLVEA